MTNFSAGIRLSGFCSGLQDWRPMTSWTAPAARLALGGAGGSYQRGLDMVTSKDLGARYASVQSFWSATEMSQMGLDPLDFPERMDLARQETLFTRISFLELGGYMRNTLLRDADALGMAQSIEIRVPFLDHELVAWCLEIGAADYSRGSGKKQLLLRAAADLLPVGTIEAQKTRIYAAYGSMDERAAF